MNNHSPDKQSQNTSLSQPQYDPNSATDFETVIIPPSSTLHYDTSDGISTHRTLQTLMHDLKNPLSVIYGTASILKQQKQLPESHRQEAIESILSSVNDMRKLISEWLNLSKLESGYVLNLQKMPIVSFTQACTESFSSVAELKNITLKFEGEDLHTEAEFDHDRMVQAINNLISNAIKYTPEGGTVTVSGHIEKDVIIIKVIDTGIGIVKEELPYIFNRFYRTKKVQTRDIDGTGLGLAIVKVIIERHNGSVDVQSVVGQGTQLTLTLPLTQPIDSKCEVKSY